MQAGKDFYHPECFSCLVCNRPFLDRQSIRRDEWGGMVHSEHFRMANSCGSCGRLFAGKSVKPQATLFRRSFKLSGLLAGCGK